MATSEHYRADLSFIATLASETPGFEGIIDSVEYKPGHVNFTRGEWLTITDEQSVPAQKFWFGCFEVGGKLRFKIKTFTPDQDLNLHFRAVGLSYNDYAGLYVTERNGSAYWRLRSPHGNFDTPTVGTHRDLCLLTADKRVMGPSQGGKVRKPLDNCYVQIASRPLALALNIEHSGVPLFDSFASDVLPKLYR